MADPSQHRRGAGGVGSARGWLASGIWTVYGPTPVQWRYRSPDSRPICDRCFGRHSTDWPHDHAPGAHRPDSRAAGATLTEQIAAHFGERIRQRLLAPGSRLPSVRDCARSHGVSPHTVVAAYDQLLAQGLVEARRQRGFFVRESAGPAGLPAGTTPGSRATTASPTRVAPVDATALIRGMFHGASDLPAPGLGTLPRDWLDLPAAGQRALRRVLSHGDSALALQYGQPAGDSRLREALA